MQINSFCPLAGFEKIKPSKKRLRESALDEAGEKEMSCKNTPPYQDAVLHMYKADALVQLGQPVMALESLDRCVNTPRNVLSSDDSVC